MNSKPSIQSMTQSYSSTGETSESCDEDEGSLKFNMVDRYLKGKMSYKDFETFDFDDQKELVLNPRVVFEKTNVVSKLTFNNAIRVIAQGVESELKYIRTHQQFQNSLDQLKYENNEMKHQLELYEKMINTSNNSTNNSLNQNEISTEKSNENLNEKETSKPMKRIFCKSISKKEFEYQIEQYEKNGKQYQKVLAFIPIEYSLVGGRKEITIQNYLFSFYCDIGCVEGDYFIAENINDERRGINGNVFFELKYENNIFFERKDDDLIGIFEYDKSYENKMVPFPYPVALDLNIAVEVREGMVTFENLGFLNVKTMKKGKYILKMFVK